MTGRSCRPGALLAVIFVWWLILAFVNARWVEAHVLKLPPPWDPALQQLIGLRLLQALQESGWATAWSEMHARSPFVPPLFPLSTIPIYWLFGTTRGVAHFTSSLYLLLHLAVVYLFGKRLGGSWAGLTAVFLFSTFGAVVNLSRDYLHDFPAAAFVALALLALASSDGLTRARHAAAFGVFAGLAAVTKSMAPVFIVPPLLYVLVTRFRRGLRPRRTALLLSSTAALLIALPWWHRHAGAALWYLWHYGVGAGAAAFAPSSGGLLDPGNLGFYAVALVNEGTSVPMALVAAGVALAQLGQPRPTESPSGTLRSLLWVWIVAGYALLTLSRNKAPDRYPVFLLTPVAALLAAGITGMARGRTVALGGALVASAWTWTAWTLDVASAPPVLFYRPPAGIHAFHPHHAWIRSTLDVPDGEWPVDEVVRRLSGMATELKRRSSLDYSARHDASASPERQVRAAFLGLLAREPDAVATRAYARQFAGARPLAEVLREIAASGESNRRSLRVAVTADHPLINASTLNYYAAAQRAAVAFVSLAEEPSPWSMPMDAVVAADRNLGPMGTLRRRLAAPDSGHERLFALRCPDGRVLEAFARALDAGTARP